MHNVRIYNNTFLIFQMSSFETNSTRDASKECPYDPLDNVTSIYSGKHWIGQIMAELFYEFIQDFFSDLGSRDGKKSKNNSSENDQLTGHFQSFSFNISRKPPSKTSKVNTNILYVLNR